MTLTQEQRHNMIESFKETNGEETAMALAESLFSNDFATKGDLKEGISRLEAKMDSHFRWMMGGFFAMFSAMITLFSVAMGTG